MGNQVDLCSLPDASPVRSATPQQLKDPSAIKKCIYIDWQLDWNSPESTIRQAVDTGYNVILLAFYLEHAPADAAIAWKNLSDQVKIDTMNYLHSHNAIMLISAVGATVVAYNMDPQAWATEVCEFARENYLDGVDLDAEGIEPGFMYQGVLLYDWFTSFFATAHSLLGSSLYLTSAPQAPYLSAPGYPFPQTWPGAGGGYTRIMEDCPYIDWLCIQFYNQGSGNYQSYDTVWLRSTASFPFSAIEQLNGASPDALPMHKLVFGTYLTSADGSSGISDPSQIRECFARASTLPWQAGSMVWMWRTDGTLPTPQQWYDVVYG